MGAGAFFALSRSRARSEKKSAKARRKKSAKKSESAERERKKARIRAFSSTHSGNPVSEPKAARQGGKARGLSEMLNGKLKINYYYYSKLLGFCDFRLHYGTVF